MVKVVILRLKFKTMALAPFVGVFAIVKNILSIRLILSKKEKRNPPCLLGLLNRERRVLIHVRRSISSKGANVNSLYRTDKIDPISGSFPVKGYPCNVPKV